MGTKDKQLASTGEIVRQARMVSGLTQNQFAKSIHRTQGEVSKYENGMVDPPGSIIMHCMNIIQAEGASFQAPSVDTIIGKLRGAFDAPKHAVARHLIMTIILNEENRPSSKDPAKS